MYLFLAEASCETEWIVLGFLHTTPQSEPTSYLEGRILLQNPLPSFLQARWVKRVLRTGSVDGEPRGGLGIDQR